MSAPQARTPLLEVRDLAVEVPAPGGRWLRAVDDVSFTVGRGETVGLVGESGSGKTLVSMALRGLAPAVGARIAGGSITFDGTDLTTVPERRWRAARGRDLAMIFQQPIRSLNPAYTVGEQIAEAARRHLGLGRRAAAARAVEMLQRVQIADAPARARQYPHEFSGGMCQRVMIAMAMVANPRLLSADEPTTALDVTVQAAVLDLIAELQAETGISVLLISHDLGVIAQTCHRAVVAYAGQTIEEGRVEEVFGQPRHPYTSALLGSLGRPGPGGRLRAIAGSIPRVGEAPPGCRFAPRCPEATASCTSDLPVRSVPLGDVDQLRSVRCLRADDLRLEGVQAR